MKKFFKIIAAPVLAAIMVTSVSAPAMAAELPQEVVNAPSVVTANAVQPRAWITSQDCSGTFKQGVKLCSVYVGSRAKTIKYSVNGLGGNVVIRLNNQSTADSRSFTATANGSMGSITYVTSMDTGTWDVVVEFTSGLGHNNLHMEFYS